MFTFITLQTKKHLEWKGHSGEGELRLLRHMRKPGPVLFKHCVITFAPRANRLELTCIQNNKDTIAQTREKKWMLVPIHRTHVKA